VFTTWKDRTEYDFIVDGSAALGVDLVYVTPAYNSIPRLTLTNGDTVHLIGFDGWLSKNSPLPSGFQTWVPSGNSWILARENSGSQ
jgi:hypothetical protein